MALPASGQISASQINTELAVASTSQMDINGTAVRTLFGVASGQIAFSNGYGKSAAPVERTWVVGAGSYSSNWKYTASTGNTMVAVSFNSGTTTAMKSADSGSTWSTVTLSASTAYYTGVAYGNGVFVALSDLDAVRYSSDGTTWSSASIDANFANGMYATNIAFGNGVFVITMNGKNYCYTSTNATTWTQRALPAGITAWGHITFMNGHFYALNDYYTAGSTLYRSADGISWGSAINLPSSEHWSWWQGMAYGNGVYVILNGQNGVATYATSTDGVNWTSRTFPNALWEASIAFNNGTFVVIVYGQQNYWTSTDAINWTIGTLPAAFTSFPTTIGTVGTKFVIFGSDGVTVSSS